MSFLQWRCGRLCYDAEDPSDEGRREFLTRYQPFALFSPHFPSHKEEKQSKYAVFMRNKENVPISFEKHKYAWILRRRGQMIRRYDCLCTVQWQFVWTQKHCSHIFISLAVYTSYSAIYHFGSISLISFVSVHVYNKEQKSKSSYIIPSILSDIDWKKPSHKFFFWWIGFFFLDDASSFFGKPSLLRLSSTIQRYDSIRVGTEDVWVINTKEYASQ